MTEDTTTPTDSPAAEPNPALKQLDVLVGTWTVTGPELAGQVTFEWMEGGFYFLQHVDLDHAGNRTTGIEYIGYDPSRRTLQSYFFGNQAPGPFAKVALEYAWEVGADTLTIWGGEVGSPASYQGTFSDDHSTVTGRWQWPGGGYESTMTKTT